MNIVKLALVILSFFIGPMSASAQTWGPARVIKPGFDRQAALHDIFKDLATAESQQQARLIAERLKLTLMQAPDKETAEWMNRALRAAGGYNFDKAMGYLDKIIAKHPTYTEGWNQRAFVHFVRERYDQSLADCRKVVELEPRHIGCLSGMARILIRHRKQYFEGEKLLREAIALHPFIYEKVLLAELPNKDL